MQSDRLILPRADSGCGKAFYNDRRTAVWHRIALEFWKQATGGIREGYHLAVYRCRRCGGFHIGQKRIERLYIGRESLDLHPDPNHDQREAAPFRAQSPPSDAS
jgi:hypothetical protein